MNVTKAEAKEIIRDYIHQVYPQKDKHTPIIIDAYFNDPDRVVKFSDDEPERGITLTNEKGEVILSNSNDMCPRCGYMDTVEYNANRNTRECLHCGITFKTQK